MTIAEYELRMEAYQLKRVEKLNFLATQAWFNQIVQATTGSPKNPKPKYKKLADLYDHQMAIDEIRTKYEPDYHAQSQSRLTPEKQKQVEIFIKRQKEFEEKWKNRQKRGGN